MTAAEPLWRPTQAQIDATQVRAFIHAAQREHGAPQAWDEFWRWSIERREIFWREMLRFADIQIDGASEPVVEGAGMLGTRWFPAARLNYARHMLRFRGSQAALLFENERGRQCEISRDQMRAQVAACQNALIRAGVRPGDRVAGYMPNLPETVVAMLAAAGLGAIWSSCSPDFGVRGVLDRFGQIEPRVLIAADGYTYAGKRISVLDRVAEICEQLPSVRRVIVVPHLDATPDISGIRDAGLWAEELSTGNGDAAEPRFESLPFDHPLFVMYSSGTTGVPKCIVHGHGGTLLQHAKEHLLHCDLREGERMLYFTTCGWMMWNWLVSGLGCGAGVVLYEGNPAHPDTQRLWQLCERLRVNVLGVSPKFLAACRKAEIRPRDQQNLPALRAVLSTGSPLSDDLFEWVYEAVKSDLLLASISGGTDIISCFMLGNPTLPVYAGQIQCRGLGMDVQAWDDQQRPVVGQKGELICCSPFPSQPIGFWNDPDRRKYRAAYFDHYPGRDVWRHGDYVEVTPQGGIVVYGRSDATLNPGGVRIGTAELYRVVEAMPEVLDSLVVGRDTPDDDVEICLFIVLRPGYELTPALEQSIRERIAAETTRRHVPRHIRDVREIPVTVSGKKVELAVQEILRGRQVRNREALANPQALDQFVGILDGT